MYLYISVDGRSDLVSACVWKEIGDTAVRPSLGYIL